MIISSPVALHEIGKRDNNEDYILPEMGKASANTHLFIVCDGIGGHEKGEVASRLAATSFERYFNQNPVTSSDKQYIDNAFSFVQAEFDAYIDENPEAKGMGTTLTLLHIHSEGITAAHCGDSRIYQLRNNQILWKTEDHSYVNELLSRNIITPEEAVNHPQRNVISRAIMGKSVKDTEAEVAIITDIHEGDYFFLCTDGVQESISDEQLTEIISLPIADDAKMEKIRLACQEHSKDNHSAYLLKVQLGTEAPTSKPSIIKRLMSIFSK